MNQVDGVSDMVSLLCSSVWGRTQIKDIVCCLASGVLSGRKLSPGNCPHGRQFSFSPYATGALPAAVPVLEPRGSKSA